MRDLAFAGIILGILGVGAAFAIPSMLAPKCGNGNETAAIATLRNLGSVQAQFQGSGRCDLDGDGIGEFGTLGELTGSDGLRADASGGSRGAVLSPPVLSASLASVDESGAVCKSGHAFRIFLPGGSGGGVYEGGSPEWANRGKPRAPVKPSPPDTVHGTPFSGPVDVNGTEGHWCAYAWPVAYANSGRRAFFVDEGGSVWWTSNADGKYSGTRAGPAWDAAMPADSKKGWASAPDAKEYRGRDGNVWVRTN